MKNMRKKCSAAVMMLFLIFLSFSMPVWAADTEGLPAVMEVSSAYGRIGKMGCHIPLTISLYGQASFPFTGTVNVKTLENAPDDGGEIYEYSYPVTVGTAETKKIEIYVPLGQRSSEICVCLCDGNGKEIEKKTLSFDISRTRGRLLIGALSDETEELKFLDGVNLDYGMISSALLPLDSRTFPEDVRGLDVLDILVINHFDSGTLTEEQRAAVIQWVENGGVLLFGTGSMVYETLEPFFGVFSGISVLEVKKESVGMGAEYAENAPGDSSLDMVCADLWIPGGAEVMESDGQTLLTMLTHGRGKVGFFSYDLGDICRFAETRPAYTIRILTDVLGEDTISQLYYYSCYGKDEEYWNAQSLVNTGSADRLPNLKLYAAVAVLYILAAGPGLYYLLKKRDLSRYYGGAVVLASVVTSAVIYLMGTQTRFTTEFYTVATILDTEGEIVDETTYLDIRTPDSRPFSVQIPESYEVTPLTRTGRYEEQPVLEFDTEKSANVRICREDGGTVLSAKRSRAFEPRYFKLEQTSEKTFSGNVTGELEIFDGKVSGYVVNGYPFTLSDAALILYGQMYPLGDLEAGEVRRFEEEPLLTWPVSMPYVASRWLSGRQEAEESDDGEYLRSVGKSGLYSYYLEKYYGVYTSEVRIAAFGPGNGLWGSVSSGGQATDGQILYTEKISASFERDGLIYRSGLINPPSVTTGNGSYYSDGMSLYGTEPIAVEYFLGTDIDVEKVSFLPVSEELLSGEDLYYLKRFDGEAYFYNFETRTYDRAELSGADIPGRELKPYLSAEGSLLVKYAAEETEISETSLLPVLMVTGRER